MKTLWDPNSVVESSVTEPENVMAQAPPPNITSLTG